MSIPSQPTRLLGLPFGAAISHFLRMLPDARDFLSLLIYHASLVHSLRQQIVHIAISAMAGAVFWAIGQRINSLTVLVYSLAIPSTGISSTSELSDSESHCYVSTEQNAKAEACHENRRHGFILLDPVRRRVERNGIEVHLTAREFNALRL